MYQIVRELHCDPDMPLLIAGRRFLRDWPASLVLDAKGRVLCRVLLFSDLLLVVGTVKDGRDKYPVYFRSSLSRVVERAEGDRLHVSEWSSMGHVIATVVVFLGSEAVLDECLCALVQQRLLCKEFDDSLEGERPEETWPI